MPVCWVHKQRAYKTPCYRIREGRDLSTSLQIHLAEVKISKFFYQSEFPITLKYIILRQDDPFCVQNAVESHEQIKSRQVTKSQIPSREVTSTHVTSPASNQKTLIPVRSSRQVYLPDEILTVTFHSIPWYVKYSLSNNKSNSEEQVRSRKEWNSQYGQRQNEDILITWLPRQI